MIIHCDILLLTGELGLPLREALLLHGVEVWQVVVLVFQGLLLQAERSQASRCISACEHSIWPPCQKRGKKKTQQAHRKVLKVYTIVGFSLFTAFWDIKKNVKYNKTDKQLS